jgi:hypothetical protein
MSQDFRRITEDDVNEQLRIIVEDSLRELLSKRQPGHCMRVGDLDSSVMLVVAKNLRNELGVSAQIHVLSNEPPTGDSLLISSSKLVELRNPHVDGTLRPPLLVFVPNNLRTAAEDSFAEATFEQVSIANVYPRLHNHLIQRLPTSLQATTAEVVRLIAERDWRWADGVGVARFLISIYVNGAEPETVGASLCEIGLVPDFNLLDMPSELPQRLAKNLECVDKLTFSTKSDHGRVLELQLKNRTFRTRLSEVLVDTGMEEPNTWTRRIVLERSLWPLSFDKWVFEDNAGFSQQLRVEVLDVTLPEISAQETDPHLRQLIGQKVLLIGKNGTKSFTVKFRCEPAPSNVAVVDHFRLQIFSRESGPTAFTKKKKTWSGTRRDASIGFSGLSKVEWEDGWHFVRALPYTADGDPIPIVDENGNPIPILGSGEGTQLMNESDPFYVVQTDSAEVEVPQRAVPKFPSYSHSAISCWFKSVQGNHSPDSVVCTHRAWVDSDDNKGRSELLEFKFAGEGLVHVPVSRILKLLEQRILASPAEMNSWRLIVSAAQSTNLTSDELIWPALPESEAFLTARRELFDKLRGQDGLQILESTDIFSLRTEIVRYAETYLAVVSQGLRIAESAASDQQTASINHLQRMLSLDTATVDLTDHRGGHRTALLMGPTHPLRLLWLATWSTLAWHWASKSQENSNEFLSPTRDALLDQLSLVNFPSAIPAGSGRLLSAIDNIHPFWTVYTSSTETDPRGLIAELCTALGLSEPSIGSFTLNGHFLADRVRRYVVQHPYVHTLTINCFNAGRGRLLADMMLELQKEHDLRNMHYNLRLFVTDPDAPGAGEDLGDLISPNSSLAVPEADVFATPTGNHLSPKLTFCVRDISDFRLTAGDFPSHLSILFDVFPPQSLSAVPPRPDEDSAPVYGLLQDFAVSYVETAEIVAWHRRPRHGIASPIPEAPEFSFLLARLSETMSSAAASIAVGQFGISLRPVSTLVLDADQKALLHKVHEQSDWVFTIDKNLGVEFFDHHPASRRPEYLIDHSPDLAANIGRRVVITSRSQTEIRVLFERVLQEHGLDVYKDRAHALLAELRALSGRLALKLVSSPNQSSEALGLALATLFLEFQNAFRDQAVIPLDAHLDLYRAFQKSADELADDVTLRRTDLALFDFNPSQRIITCSLIEVKCYRGTGGLSGFTILKQSIADQIRQSEKMFRHHFDAGQAENMDRPDRVMKTHELSTLLEFYVDRAHRLNLLSPDAFAEAKFFLRTIEVGYSLRFTRSALVFDFEKAGADEFVEENGIEYHRIGIDLITKLVEALPAKSSEDETMPFAQPKVSTIASDQEKTAIQVLATSMPRLSRAAFLRESRDRSVSWDKLSQSTFDDTNTLFDRRQPVVPLNPRMELVQTNPPASLPPLPQIEAVIEQPQFAQPIDMKPQEIIDVPPVCPPPFDVMLGDTSSSAQYGVLGKSLGHTIALDLNQTHTISLFGVQGGGKSYTLGSIIEMASLRIPGVNNLPNPLATVVFHYSPTQDYKPEFTTVNRPNDDQHARDILAKDYHAGPAALKDVVLLVPEAKISARRLEYPDIEILPLKFASKELQAAHWRFLMGAVGNQATYIRKLNQIMRSLRDNLTLQGLREAVQSGGLPDNLQEMANLRLDLAQEYIDDDACISSIVRPGRLVIVDLRDEFIIKDEALGLFVVLLQLFADATYQGKSFNKLVVFDEAHKYIDNPDLVAGMVSVVREMRHKGTSVLVASQDPPSVPISLIELSSQIILHRFNSPAWLKHIQKANAALTSLTPEQLSRLNPGEAYVWSAKASDNAFSHGSVKISLRPRVTKHGGSTRTANG